jgi:hypothetical protein
MTERAHARLSASGSHRWIACPGSLLLEETLPERTSSYAEQGTRAHAYGSFILDPSQPECRPDDNEMLEACSAYAKIVHDYAQGGALMVERRVDFSHWLGVPESFGTSDVVILHDQRITIVDLKYGMGVKVDAENNEQMQLYALGALYEFEPLGPFDEVTMVIHQPRLGHVSEWTVPVKTLYDFALVAAQKAREALQPGAALNPSEKACKFCRAKAVCPALLAEVTQETRDFFIGVDMAQKPVDELARAMAKVAMIEDWAKAIRAETERRLFDGVAVEGFKLVQGRKGNRQWASVDEAEAAMKRMKLKRDEMYDLSLISPPAAEKLLKDTPRRWAKLNELITQTDGKPSVAPATDRRPEWTPTMVQGFAALADESSNFV